MKEGDTRAKQYESSVPHKKSHDQDGQGRWDWVKKEDGRVREGCNLGSRSVEEDKGCNSWGGGGMDYFGWCYRRRMTRKSTVVGLSVVGRLGGARRLAGVSGFVFRKMKNVLVQNAKPWRGPERLRTKNDATGVVGNVKGTFWGGTVLAAGAKGGGHTAAARIYAESSILGGLIVCVFFWKINTGPCRGSHRDAWNTGK